MLGLLMTPQAPPKTKKVKEAAKTEEKKEEPQAEKEEVPAENGEAKADEVFQVSLFCERHVTFTLSQNRTK